MNAYDTLLETLDTLRYEASIASDGEMSTFERLLAWERRDAYANALRLVREARAAIEEEAVEAAFNGVADFDRDTVNEQLMGAA